METTSNSPRTMPPVTPLTRHPSCLRCLNQPDEQVAQQIAQLQSTATFSPKINPGGWYLPFFGYTVISHRQGNDGDDIYRMLSGTKQLQHHLTLLPVESYHITIYDIFTHNKRFRAPWLPGHVPQDRPLPLTGALLDALTRGDDLCRHRGRSFTAAFSKTSFSWTPGGALVIMADILDDDWTGALRKDLSDVFKHQPTTFPFHMTVGYCFRWPPNGSTKDAELRREVQEVSSFLVGRTMRFQTPEVTVFSDMTRFVPLQQYVENCGEHTH